MFRFSPTATAVNGQTIVSYLWEQIDITDVRVILDNEDQPNSSFSAPYVSATTTLKFRLTVTDDLNGTSSDTTSVTINADPDAPKIHVTFPTPGANYNPSSNDNKIAIFGKAQTKAGSSLSKITVIAITENGSTSPVNAVISGNNWRASDFSIPADISSITFNVVAEDSLERISEAYLRLGTSETKRALLFPNSRTPKGLLWDEEEKILWLLHSGFFTDSVRLEPINPRSGAVGDSILTQPLATHTMIFNKDQSEFIVSGGVWSETAKLHSVQKSDGLITVISGDERGNGEELGIASAGLSLASGENHIYVGENNTNGFSGIMRIDISTGNREVLLESEDRESPGYAIADIAYNELNGEVIIIYNNYIESSIHSWNPDTKILKKINKTDTKLINKGKIIIFGEDVFAISAGTNLIKINLSTGLVSPISNNLIRTGGFDKLFTYSASDQLFYIISRTEIDDELGHVISVVDELSGHVIDLVGQ
ncbi:hypothetical protein C4F51_05735 [Cellvibrio sp. KB43]|uniref:Uncharacterized protein n=1 Tax=Cellvibrio polysaccharolyticus TaxID=2082724 RepID=A0A928V5X1_9GAMM|nr:hypothetical protein [Cellvibrio polysaccharolyticus]